MPKSLYFTILWVSAIGLWLTACEPQKDQKVQVEEIIRPVKTMLLTSPETQRPNHHPGKVQAYQRAELAFRVPGTLIELAVKEGKEVKKGALLARLDPRDYKTKIAQVKSTIAQAVAELKAMKAGARPEEVNVLQAEVLAAQARFQEAKQQFERYQDLWRKRVISKSEYDRQESAYNVAKAQLNTTEQNLQKGKIGARQEDIEAMISNIKGLQAQLEAAQDALNDTYLKAPFAGVVAKKLVENYQHIQAKEPILIFQDISKLDLVINIPEQFVVHAKKPEHYKTVAVFDAVPGREFPLEIKEYSTEADPKTQTYRAVLTMPAPDPEDVRILPGMTTTVIATEKQMKTSTIPRSVFLAPVNAVFADELDKKYIWIVEPEGMTVEKREVKVGDLIGESIRVIEGVKKGERIVTAGVHFLQPGQKIRLLEGGY
jgi:membrane fusion protein, multidrug efflux system